MMSLSTFQSIYCVPANEIIDCFYTFPVVPIVNRLPIYHYGFFFLHTLPSTRADLNMRHFMNFTIKIYQFVVTNCAVRLLSTTLTSKCLAEKDIKYDVKNSKRHPDVILKSRITLPPV